MLFVFENSKPFKIPVEFLRQVTQHVLKCQKELLNYDWSDSSPRLQRLGGWGGRRRDDCAGTLRGTPTYSTPLPIPSVTLHVFMATRYTNTPGVMEKKGTGNRAGQGVLCYSSESLVFLIGLFSSPPLWSGCIAPACRGRSDRNLESRVVGGG